MPIRLELRFSRIRLLCPANVIHMLSSRRRVRLTFSAAPHWPQVTRNPLSPKRSIPEWNITCYLQRGRMRRLYVGMEHGGHSHRANRGAVVGIPPAAIASWLVAEAKTVYMRVY